MEKTREQICLDAIEIVKEKALKLSEELGIKVYGFAVVTEQLEIKEAYFKMPNRYTKSIVFDLYHAQKPSEAHDVIMSSCVVKEHSCNEIWDENQTEESDLVYYGFQRSMSSLIALYPTIDESIKKK